MAQSKLLEDRELVERYLSRDEQAIRGTEQKYGLTKLSEHITEDACDAQEACISALDATAVGSPPKTFFEKLKIG